ncbi:hypothetical protein MBLNU230_g1033t1 [Neophaeotheca triangularis]
MDDFHTFASDDDDGLDNDFGKYLGVLNARDTTIQILLSAALGITAFLAFCFLRPRWPGLYSARKQHKDESDALPDLPDTFFGWIMPLWRITDQQVLASAGLDAYVFLAFFKLAIKFLTITFFLSLIIIKPVHDAYPEEDSPGKNGTKHNSTKHHHGGHEYNFLGGRSIDLQAYNGSYNFLPDDFETDYLWMYVAFAYLFTGIAVYLVISETRRIIEVRQEFLGGQTTITDRTIRLSGVPRELQDEAKIKEFIESLDIGKVDSVMLCRKWKELDDAMVARMDTLRRLEEAYSIHAGNRSVERNLESLPVAQPEPPEPLIEGLDEEEGREGEGDGLLGGNGAPAAPSPTVRPPYAHMRPTTKVRYGRFKLRSKTVDAITHYEQLLREADEEIATLRKKDFEPTPLAFVTMDSVASCQMAVQAVLDPSPLQLIANQSPAPADVIWPNTYISRRGRMFRSWSITLLIVLLTIFWSAVFVPIAGLLNTSAIGKVLPQLAEFLEDHRNLSSLVNTQLPTLIASLLMVLVPYLYYYLSTHQGFISQGEIELSTISKNFFFTFFNFFVIFTVLGTASKFYQFFERFGDAIKDFRKVAYTLALSLQRLLNFYVDFIILQGFGLFPFRLLEVGSVVMYPLMLMGAKTPRDYAELIQPPVFSYGFYLPSALLIFIIALVYSVLRSSWQVLLASLAYFTLGHAVYKYQLLYAMDHGQHSTGAGWGMICDRIFVGLVFFQLTTAGQLLLKQAVTRSLLMVPLVIATVWFCVVYGRTYKPLMRFIALRSVRTASMRASAPAGYRDSSPVGEGEVSQGGQGMDAAADASMSDELATAALAENVWASSSSTPESSTPKGVPSRRGDETLRRLRYARETRAGRYVDESRESGVRFINPSLVAP